MSATSSDSDLIELIKAQIEGLRKTPDGLFLYRMIDRGLQNRGGEYTGDTGNDFINFLHALLHKYASNPDGDTVTRVKVRLLQQRLAPHLDNEEEQAAPEPAAFVVTKPPEPEEVIIEGLPDEPVNVQTDDRQASNNTIQPEALEIDGLELDESTFEEELEKRATDDVVAERPSLSFEEEKPLNTGFDNADEIESAADELTNRSDRESRDAKAEAIKASMRPLVDIDEAPKPSAPSSAVRHDRHEIEMTVDDNLSLGGLAEESERARFSITDRVPKDVKQELSRKSREPAKPKPSPPRPDDDDVPDIVVGEESFVKAPEPRPLAAGAILDAGGATPVADARNSSRDRVDKLHETFAGKLADSISRSRDYHKLLKTNLKALKLADSPDDVIDIKHLLVMGLEDLLKGNDALGKDLGATNHYLKISQLDRDLLKDELGRVRDQSLVDELTGLQNKVAFSKQVEAEIGRSKRYGFSLALSVIVLDRLDTYREQNGKDAGDEIIRTLANQMLAGFHDAVARLHDDKFGILFPNTQKEGALSALEKAQKHAADTVIQFNGKSLSLPTFTSSLTLYSPGDKPEVLMKRAYDALAIANKNSRDKIIVALAQT